VGDFGGKLYGANAIVNPGRLERCWAFLRPTSVRANSTSHPPSCQSRLSTRRVILNSVDGLPGQAGLFGDLSHAHGLLSQHGAHLGKLFRCEARLAAKVRALATLLGVLDTGPLSGLGGLGAGESGEKFMLR